MRWRQAAALLLLAGCTRHTSPPAPQTHYVVGAPYELGGTWSYPRESFDADETGLAIRADPKPGAATDGELDGADAMTGAHRTLQLPAIATVTNLQTGRQVRVRLNARGPAQPGRLVALSPKAADLLGVAPGGTAPVRLQVESGPSQALRDQLGGDTARVTAAPVGAVQAESLPAPGAGSNAPRAAAPAAAAIAAPAAQERDWLAPLPPVVTETTPQPGQLYLSAGRFSGSRYANAVKSRLSGLPVEIRREGGRSGAEYVVMAGPFATVAQADRALDQARTAGVTDAAIVIE